MSALMRCSSVSYSKCCNDRNNSHIEWAHDLRYVHPRTAHVYPAGTVVWGYLECKARNCGLWRLWTMESCCSPFLSSPLSFMFQSLSKFTMHRVLPVCLTNL